MITMKQTVVEVEEVIPEHQMQWAVIWIPNQGERTPSVYAMFRERKDADAYLEPIRQNYNSHKSYDFPFEIRRIVK